MATMPAGSSPFAGSSRSSSRGSLSSAAAIPSRCFMPSEYVWTLSRARSRSPTSSSSSSIRPFGVGRPGRSERSQVLAPGKVRIERWRLDERPDVEQAVPVGPPERLAKHLDRARVGMDQAGQQPHRGRLAGAIRAEEAVHDAGRHGQVKAVQGDP